MKIIKSSILVCLAMVLLLALSVTSFAQEKKEITNAERQKAYKEISGEWEFDAMGEILIISFYIEDEKLLAMQEGDDEVVDMVPVEGELYSFTAEPSDGTLYELTFKKDEEGKVTLCMLAGGGMEIEGVKIDD